MKIAIIGADGQLGYAISREASSQGFEVETLSREQLDVSKLRDIETTLAGLNADHILNCTAYNAVDRAELEPDSANLVNGLAPGVMAAACRRQSRGFVHFSTDYVFGEGHNDPIDESHDPAPLSAYGRSKRMGELRVLDANPDAMVVRTTGLYSGRRRNFVTSMLGYARDGRELTVVNDQWVSPTWVQPLAEVSIELLSHPIAGIIHAVSHGSCTWYELAAKTFELSGVEANLAPISQRDWAADARRPAYSVLDNGVLRAIGLDRFEPWHESLARFIEDESP